MSQNTCVLQRVTWRNILNQFMRKKNHLNVNFVTIDISTEGPSARNWWARQTSVLFFNEICQKWIDELRAYQFIICVKHHVFISELYARILHAWCIAYRFWNCEVLGWHPNTLSILFSKFLRPQNSKTLQIRGQIFETSLNSLSLRTQKKKKIQIGTKIAWQENYLKFRFSKKAIKFETISHMIWRLLSTCQIKWEIVSNLCGLFRMSKLEVSNKLLIYYYLKSAGDISYFKIN